MYYVLFFYSAVGDIGCISLLMVHSSIANSQQNNFTLQNLCIFFQPLIHVPLWFGLFVNQGCLFSTNSYPVCRNV